MPECPVVSVASSDSATGLCFVHVCKKKCLFFDFPFGGATTFGMTHQWVQSVTYLYCLWTDDIQAILKLNDIVRFIIVTVKAHYWTFSWARTHSQAIF